MQIESQNRTERKDIRIVIGEASVATRKIIHRLKTIDENDLMEREEVLKLLTMYNLNVMEFHAVLGHFLKENGQALDLSADIECRR